MDINEIYYSKYRRDVACYIQSRRDDILVEKMDSYQPKSRRDDILVEKDDNTNCSPTPLTTGERCGNWARGVFSLFTNISSLRD